MTTLKSAKLFVLAYLAMSVSILASAQMDMPQGMQHQHTPKNLPASALTPQLTISIIKDSMSGVNLHLKTHFFQLESPTQEGDNPSNIVEGHGHLYINGKKIQRVYGPDVHIPAKHIKKGVNQISVTLNGHDHSAWIKDGKEIISTIFINTEKEKYVSHQFSSFPVVAKN